MYTVISLFAIFASIVLVLVVLVQNSKGGGLSTNFSSSNQIMGVRKTTEFIEKLTWGLAAFIMLLSILSVGITKKAGTGPQTEISAPVAAPSSTTAPDVTLPGAQNQSSSQGKPAAPAQQQKQSAAPAQQSQTPIKPLAAPAK